jgi:hypothetical protein
VLLVSHMNTCHSHVTKGNKAAYLLASARSFAVTVSNSLTLVMRSY